MKVLCTPIKLNLYNMKTISPIFVLTLVALMSISCMAPITERIDAFVDDVEMNYASYTEEDWQVADLKYNQFKVEFAKKYDKLTQPEKDIVNQSFGRYDAIIAKDKVEDVVDDIKSTVKDAGEWIKGVVEGVTSEKPDQEGTVQ